MIVNKKELDRFAEAFKEANKGFKIKGASKEDITMVMFLGMLNGYLFVLKHCKVRKRQYNLIKEAFQDITNWIVPELDIETFEKNKD